MVARAFPTPLSPFVKPIIHGCCVLLRYTAESQSGKQESRDHTLDDNDALWVELRHSHIADVYTTLAKRFGDFQEKNRAAK